MQTILVVDDVAICREPLAEALRHHGYNVVCAADGHGALSQLRRARPDLVLLDVTMPDLDGIGVLRAMRRDVASRDIPVILLTDVNDKDRVLCARELGAQGYMLKSGFDLNAMLARIDHLIGQPLAWTVSPTADGTPGHKRRAPEDDTAGAVQAHEWNARAIEADSDARDQGQRAAEPLQTTIRPLRDATVKRLEQLGRLKALAGAVAEVIGVANSPTADRADLATALKQDSVLTARVLQVANSAAYRRNRPPVHEVEHAIGAIGFATVRNIATTVGLFDAFALNSADGLEALRCWQHCLAVAKIMEQITPQSAGGVPHVLGLCHDLGEIVLRQYFANEYRAAADVAMRTGRPMHEAEMERFGLSHRELTCLSLTELGLPREIAEPIRQFWTDPDGVLSHTMGNLARALRRANHYAHGLLYASTPSAVVGPISRDDYEGDLRGSTTVEINESDLRAAVVTSTLLLARQSPAVSTEIEKPLLPRTGVRMCYVRDASFVALDPLGTALQQLVQLEVRTRLPTQANDLVGCSGLIVAAPDCARGNLAFSEIDRARCTLGCPSLPVLCLIGPRANAEATSLRHIRIARYPSALNELVTAIRQMDAM